MTQPIPAPVGPTDAVTAALTKLLKPGSRTSEFVMLVAIYGGALATLLGAFNTHSPRFNAILKIAALVAAAASHIGYALSRGDVKQALSNLAGDLVDAGVILPVSSGKHALIDSKSDSGAVDIVGLVAGVLVIAGLIWLVVGFTHHTLDVFGLVLLLVGLGVYLVFGGAWRGATWRRRP